MAMATSLLNEIFLKPGEYAVVEYSPPVEQGITLQVYDFSIRSKSK